MTNKYIEKIKEIRIQRGLSQDSVAKAIGVSRPTYTAIESGKKQSIDFSDIQKLASFFGLNMSELIYGSVEDIDKYKQMIIAYLRMNISSKNDGKVPKTKLAKLLYLADFAWYYNNLKSMSGMQYKKFTYGPVPDAFFRIIDELEADGKIIVDRRKDDNKNTFLVSESDSNKNEKITTISKEEQKLMNKIAEKWKDKNTQDIVNFTHNQLPYTICRDNEVIPYELITQEDTDKVY